MNRINIQRPTGFPVQKQTFDFLQDTFGSAIEHLCRAHGDNLILHGATVSGTTISAGAVVIDGEVLPFEQSFIGGGGVQNQRVEIVETSESALYKSGEFLPTYLTRVARIGVNGTIPFSALRRIQRPRQQTDWVNCTPTDNITVLETIQCRINENGKVELRGKFRHNADYVNTVRDVQLPNGFIPTYNRTSAIATTEPSEGHWVRLVFAIPTSGMIFFNIDTIWAENHPNHIFELKTEFDL